MKSANFFEVIICLIVTYGVFVLFDSAFLKRRSFIYPIGLSVYSTVLVTLTVLSRQSKTQSSYDTLFVTYKEAIAGNLWAFHAIIFNIVLFIPFGLLLLKYCKKSKWFAAFIIVIPLILETVQLMTSRGVFEISDIINNIIGGFSGLIIGGLIKKYIRIKRIGEHDEHAK